MSGRRLIAMIALLVVLTFVAVPSAVVAAGPRRVADPDVRGPIGAGGGLEGGIRGIPFGSSWYDLAPYGYVEEEFFVSGNAPDPYVTRILVSRPTSAARFNGTAVLEWENVTAQTPQAPHWIWANQMLTDEGFAHVQVSVQAAGTCCSPLSLQGWDPLRYAALSHPGDEAAFEIFNQVAQAVRHPRGVDPLRGLRVERVLASGHSQSAIRLHSYVNDVHRDVRLIDGFLIDADLGAGKAFPNLDVPVLQVHTEEGMVAEPPPASRSHRLWEVAGPGHIDSWVITYIPYAAPHIGLGLPAEPHGSRERFIADAGQYGEDRGEPRLGCVTGDEFPRRYVVDAAFHHLDRWARTGAPPPAQPRVHFMADGTPARDAFGNVVGGMRYPLVDVPVASYDGAACELVGQTSVLDDATIARLYPTHADYVTKMQRATSRAVDAGSLLPSDARDLMARVRASGIGT